MIRVLQEVSGFARSRVEAALSRGRGSRGAGGVSVGVVGGNLFYTAQPLGVRDGIDLGSTGEVRWASGGPSVHVHVHVHAHVHVHVHAHVHVHVHVHMHAHMHAGAAGGGGQDTRAPELWRDRAARRARLLRLGRRLQCQERGGGWYGRCMARALVCARYMHMHTHTACACARYGMRTSTFHTSNNDSDFDSSDYDTHQVASRAAAALGASKLIFLSYSRLMTRTTFPGNVTANFALASQQPAWLGEASSDGEVGLRQVQSMRLGDAKRLVQDRAEALELAEESCNVELDSMASCTVASVLALCGHCVGALEQVGLAPTLALTLALT